VRSDDGGAGAGFSLLDSWMSIDGGEAGDWDEHPFTPDEESRKVSLFSTIISSLRVLILNLILFNMFSEDTNRSVAAGKALLVISHIEELYSVGIFGISQTSEGYLELILHLEAGSCRLAKGSEEQTPSLLTFMMTETGTEVILGSAGLGVRGGVLDINNLASSQSLSSRQSRFLSGKSASSLSESDGWGVGSADSSLLLTAARFFLPMYPKERMLLTASRSTGC